jgi:hypothetical protein
MEAYGGGGLTPQISYLRLQINLLSNCSTNKFRFASSVPSCLNFVTLQTYQLYDILPSIVVMIHQLKGPICFPGVYFYKLPIIAQLVQRIRHANDGQGIGVRFTKLEGYLLNWKWDSHGSAIRDSQVQMPVFTRACAAISAALLSRSWRCCSGVFPASDSYGFVPHCWWGIVEHLCRFHERNSCIVM